MPVSKLEIASKGTIFAVAISLITAGSNIIEENLYAGVALLVSGVALIVIWAYLIDWQARKEAREAVSKAFKEFKLKTKRGKEK